MKRIILLIVLTLFFSDFLYSQWIKKEKNKVENYLILTGGACLSYDNNGILLGSKRHFYGMGWDAGIGSNLFKNRMTWLVSMGGERFFNYYYLQTEEIKLTKFRTLTTSVKVNIIDHKISGLLDGTGGGLESGLAFVEKDKISNITGSFLQLNMNFFWVGRSKKFKGGFFVRGTYYVLFFDFDDSSNLKNNPGVSLTGGINIFFKKE